MIDSNKPIIKQNEIVILKVRSEVYNQSMAKILKSLIPEYSKCIYLSLNKPSSFLLNLFPKNEVDISKIVVIDCASEKSFVEQKSTENVIFCGTPPDFIQINILIEETARKIPGKKLLVLDSLSNLLVYSSENNAVKFLEYIISLLRSLNMSGILLAVAGESSSRIEEYISPSCDRVSNYQD